MNIKKTIKNNIRSYKQKRIVGLCILALATNFAVSAYGVPVADVGSTAANSTSQVAVFRQDASGGGVVTVQSIRFTGYVRYTEVLTAVFADAVGKTFDLAGLQGLTHRITAHYRSHGVPFARALIPAQPMTDGALIIHIIEGPSGRVKAEGDDKRAANAHEVSVVAVPDAGATAANVTSQVAVASQDASGGGVVTVQGIRFTGYVRYTEVLTAVFADAVGRTFDLAGLQGLTQRITAQYRSNDVPFARALLPVQPMTDGDLVIHIIEGRYGSIKAKGDDNRAANAQVFLQSLQAGQVIESSSLERAALILADQPGFDSSYAIGPGQASGTGDLDVRVKRSARYSGEQGFDNYGNRFTGRRRGYLNLDINSPFFFGDQLKFNTLYSEENLWVGALNYSLPFGGTGLRANVGYAHTNYELGQEFASAKAQGTARISSAGLSYPIIRSQQANLSLAGTYQHKVLNNSDGITSSSNTNRSESLPISLSFDRRDQLAGGGITYGEVSWTHGDLALASANRAVDSTTAKTSGGFDKINLNVARLQALPVNLNLFGRISAQWAGKNLDSSEKFGLGGVNGVRAYPSGEAFGDEGVLMQLEVRYAINSFAPYVFFDAGTLNINHDTFTVGDNRRSLAGAGLGLRFNKNGWSIDASAAWRTAGIFSDVNQADTPTIWGTAKYKY